MTVDHHHEWSAALDGDYLEPADLYDPADALSPDEEREYLRDGLAMAETTSTTNERTDP